MHSSRFMACTSTAIVLLAGCDWTAHERAPDAAASVASSIKPSLSPSLTAQQAVLATYRGMWDAFVAAGRISDPDAPAVRKYASDQALRLIVNALYTNREQKQVIRGDLKIEPEVTALKPADEPTEATISDCVNDEKWLVQNASGGLVDDVPGGRHSTTATVKRAADGWKVSSFILKEPGTC